MSRLWGSVLAFSVVAAAAPPLLAQGTIENTLDCAAYQQAGVVACDVSESWIAPSTFPSRSGQTWPPEGYTLIDRALLSQDSSGGTCVIPIRSLIRLRSAFYGETDVPLPPLHEGFPVCEPDSRMGKNTAEYSTIVRTIREHLPRPTFRVKPQSNTIIGIPTQLDLSPRTMTVDTETVVTLPLGPRTVRIQADGEFFVRWRDAAAATGPHVGAGSAASPPTFVYADSGDVAVDVFDVWSVRVTAEDMTPFHEVVYLGYPPLTVRVNELVLRVIRQEGDT